MKKIKVIFIVLIVIMCSFILKNKVSAITISTSETPQSIKSEEEFTITLKFDEKVQSFSAYMVYEPELFTISEKSEDKNLTISKYSDNIVSLVYGPLDNTTVQDTFKINVKSNKVLEDKDIKFKLTRIAVNTGVETNCEDSEFNIKIIKSESAIAPATENKIPDNNQIINTNNEQIDNSLSDKKLAKTGETSMILIIIMMSALTIIFKIKTNKLKKLFMMLPLLLVVSACNTNSSEASPVITGAAGTGKVRVEVFDDTRIIGISPNKNFYYKVGESNDLLLELDLLNDTGFTTYFTNPTIIKSNNRRTYLATGDEINTYEIVLYGDANGDGRVCDGNDFRKIINHIINVNGSIIPEGSSQYLAADVDLSGTINIQDLDRMRNKYLGYDGHYEEKANKLGQTLIPVNDSNPTPDNPSIDDPTGDASLRARLNSSKLMKAATATITVTINPIELANQGVIFDITPSNLAEINNVTTADSNGVITATLVASSSMTGNGTITVTARGENRLSSTLNFSVSNQKAGFSFNMSPATIQVGNTATITATKTPIDGAGEPRYTSENTSIATVDEITGIVTGVSAGTTNIIATSTADPSMRTELSITVIQKQFESFDWNNKPTTMTVGQTEQASITITPSDAQMPSIVWDSSEKTVATISQTGLITAVGTGSTEITVVVTGTDNRSQTKTYMLIVN